MKSRSLEYFWKEGGGKSHKSSTSSSPTSREPPIHESEDGVEEPPIQQSANENDEENEQQDPNSMPSPTTPQSSMRYTGPNATYDVDLLPHDPGKRMSISAYPANERDAIRRGYILKKPFRPFTFDFPQRELGGMRRFSVSWFGKYDWLEYSVDRDAAYCFVCYLFKDKTTCPGSDVFVNGGFKSWNKPDRLDRHVGGLGSGHNQAQEKYNNFINPKSSVAQSLHKQSSEVSSVYKSRLTYSLKCLRYLLQQGLPFRGHDESKDSLNRGNFLELLAWFAENNAEAKKVVLENAPGNNQMTAPSIQRELINCCAKETTKLIIEDLGDSFFGILADESSDISQKEQLALCLRYVNNQGKVCERFLGIVHVEDTTAFSLKEAIESLLMEYSLTLSKVRGQGYDGASNMRGEINGLKTLIMNENESAHYIHCFAHQLQLTLVAVAKENDDCIWLFEQLGYLLNVIGVSCKRREMLRNIQAQEVLQALESGEIESGQGLNQELGLARPGETRWGSYFKTILNITTMYSTIIKVLEKIGNNTVYKEDRGKAQIIMRSFESFEFIFMTHLMLEIFGYTEVLSQALQRKDQNIVNAMGLVSLTKERLQKMRDEKWEVFFETVCSFCAKHEIEIPDMNDFYSPRTRSKRFFSKVTNLHRFRVEMFLCVIDLQLQELNNRFNELNMELLMCMACFNPSNSFASFNATKLVRLAEFYPNEFSTNDLVALRFELELFVDDMRKDPQFREVKDLGELSMLLVETGKHSNYKLVYLLLRLVLILPVATASVERVFSSMTIVKNKLRNSLGDQLLNDCLITYIERDVFLKVKDDDVIDRFQNMKTRRTQL